MDPNQLGYQHLLSLTCIRTYPMAVMEELTERMIGQS
jgi:hypothetical protein